MNHHTSDHDAIAPKSNARDRPGETGSSRTSNPSGASSPPKVITSLRRLPTGSHCLDLYASVEEAADHAADFLEVAKDPAASSYWVADDQMLALYRGRTAERDPQHTLPFRVLNGPQAVRQGTKLRPTQEIVRFVQSHPDGVTAAGATISRYWTRETSPDYLEYEEWFNGQAGDRSRYLCPYDLRALPVDMAPRVLSELARHHSHLVLSQVTNPMTLLVQLLIFPTAEAVPEPHRRELEWALNEGLLEVDRTTHRPTLALKGEEFSHALNVFASRVGAT